MKKLLIIFMLFLFCGGTSNNFKLYCQVDTVKSNTQFTIDFVGILQGSFDGFGFRIDFDTTKVLFKEAKEYNVFSHENIALINDIQGSLLFAFTNSELKESFEDTLFSLTFQVKEIDDTNTIFSVSNKSALKEGEEIDKFTFNNIEIFIEQINEFLIRHFIK